MILARYAAKAFIGLRNSLVDLSVHGSSPLSKRAERRQRGLPWRRPAEEPQPSDWRSMLQAGYTDPQYQAAGGRPARVQSTASPTPPPSDATPKRRLSLVRVLVALAVVTGVGYGGYLGLETRLPAPPAAVHQTWFAPYVDVTLTPTYQFQDHSDDPARQSVLGFVVAAGKSDCTPSWGADYTLTAAGQQLAVGARIAELQQEGQQAIVSFGGESNTPLDVACPTAAALTSAYQSVIGAYHLTTIDLDIEGTALDNYAAEQRRARAIAALEKADPSLSVWLTLPVEPSGLQDDALSVIRSMLAERVSIAGINVMTMDFSSAPGAGSTMGQLAEAALNATHGQLAALYPEYGIYLRSDQIWQRLGATMLIGQNDDAGENFTVSDARTLVSFAAANHLGRISMWSINRDRQCGSSFSETGMPSSTCSGTAQSGLQFSQVFGQLQGNAVITSGADAGPSPSPGPS